MTDYYSILGVPKDASPDAIKEAYRSLARKYHPDINPDKADAAEIMAAVNEAYGVLSDADKRAAYDADPASVGRQSVEEEAKAALLQLLRSIIDNMAGLPDGTDPLKLLHETLAGNLASFKTRQQRAEKAIKDLSKTRARIKAPAGKTNLAHEVIDNLLDGLHKAKADAEHMQQVHAEAVKLMDGYSFELGANIEIGQNLLGRGTFYISSTSV